MRSLIMVLAILALSASAAFGWVCPDPDNMAIYIDGGNDFSPCVNVHDFDRVDLVMAVGNPSTGKVLAWEAVVTDVDQSAAVGNWELANGYMDYGSDQGDGTHYHAVAFLDPVFPDANGFVELMRASIIIVDHSVPMEFYIRPYPGSAMMIVSA